MPHLDGIVLVNWLANAGGFCLRKGPKVDTSSRNHDIAHLVWQRVIFQDTDFNDGISFMQEPYCRRLSRPGCWPEASCKKHVIYDDVKLGIGWVGIVLQPSKQLKQVLGRT